MSHLPRDTHRRLEPGLHTTCASGCTSTAICPPGRCVKAGRVTLEQALAAPVMVETNKPRVVLPIRTELLGVKQRPECDASGPAADGTFTCDCAPGECPGFANAKLLDTALALAKGVLSRANPTPPAALLPAERACCGTFEGSEHRSTCEAQPERVAVCCGDYAKCQAPCVMRGRWLERRDMAAERSASLSEVLKHVRRLQSHLRDWWEWYGNTDVLLRNDLPVPPGRGVQIMEDLDAAIAAAPDQRPPLPDGALSRVRKALADRGFRGDTDTEDLLRMAANIIAEDGTIIERMKAEREARNGPGSQHAAANAAGWALYLDSLAGDLRAEGRAYEGDRCGEIATAIRALLVHGVPAQQAKG